MHAREADQRRLRFDADFPDRVADGRPEPRARTHPRLRDMGITQIGLIVDFGSLPQDEIMRSLRVFADRILPHVRDIKHYEI